MTATYPRKAQNDGRNDIIVGMKCSGAAVLEAPRAMTWKGESPMRPQDTPSPYGFCQCGCGQRTNIARCDDLRYGTVRGEPLRYINGHNKRSPLTAEERFWSYVDRGGECWEWQAYRDKDGYGRFTVRELFPSPKGAHQLAYILTKGPIPEGMNVCHSCDNPPCCNPDHLFLGTTLVNVRDKIAKGRIVVGVLPLGEDRPGATLRNDQAREIRALYAAGGITQKQIARQFGTSRSTVAEIVQGKRWRHV